MHVLAIYAVNEHLAELMTEASQARLARTAKPKRTPRSFVASLFGSRQAPVPAPTKAFANL